MEYTEEVKNEADSVVDKYYINREMFVSMTKNMATHCAIQDRQSVLNVLSRVADTTIVDKAIQNEIQSITQQIEYLKSKL